MYLYNGEHQFSMNELVDVLVNVKTEYVYIIFFVYFFLYNSLGLHKIFTKYFNNMIKNWNVDSN